MSKKIGKTKTSEFSLKLDVVITVLVFALSVALSLSAYFSQEKRNREKGLEIARQFSDRFSNRLHRAVSQYEFGLKGLRGALMSVGAERFDRRAILDYTRDRNYKEEFPGALGFGLIRYIPRTEYERFVDGMRTERGQDINIRQIGSNDGDLFVIQYIEPEQENRQAVGLDIASEETRRRAALAAAISRSTTLTGPITLVQADRQSYQGFLILLPVYITDSSNNTDRLYGWVYAPLLMNRIVDDNQLLDKNFYIEIIDTSDRVETQILHSGEIDAADPDYRMTDRRIFFGRQWEVHVTPTYHLIEESINLGAPAVAAGYMLAGGFITTLTWLLTGLIRRKIQISRQTLQIASLMDTVSEGVISMDRNFLIRAWNPAADKLFELEKIDALHRPFFDCVDLDLAQMAVSSMQKKMLAGKKVSGTVGVGSGSPNSVTRIQYKLQPILDKDSNFIGATCSLQSMDRTLENTGTERQTRLGTDDWRHMMEKLGYDLRGSLNLIKGSLDLLQLSKLDASQRLSLHSGTVAFARSMESVDNLSELIEITADNVRLFESIVYIDEMLDDISRFVNQYAEENNVEVHYVFNEHMPVVIRVDRKKAEKLLLSALSVFIRHNENTELLISFSGSRTAKNDIKIVVSASAVDNAVAQKALSKTAYEYDINKFIADSLAVLLGGSFLLSQDDAYNMSLSFAGKDDGIAEKSVNLYRSNENIRVLIVDDSDVSIMALSAAAMQLGWHVQCATDALRALRILKECEDAGEKIDVILLDWKLPDTDGWILAEKIRTTYGDSSPSIIMITAHNTELLSQMYDRSPHILNGLMVKPVTRSRLVAEVSRVLSMPIPVRTLFPEGPSGEQLKGLKLLVVEDSMQSQLLIKKILEEQGADVVVVNEGDKAIAEVSRQQEVFDAVLMDIQLPDMNGREVSVKMRNSPQYNDVPIIAVTAAASADQRKACEDAGMNDYIEKPFSNSDLVFTILKHTGSRVRSGLEQAVASKPPSQTGVSAFGSDVDEFCSENNINIAGAFDRFAASRDMYFRSLMHFANELEKAVVYFSDLKNPNAKHFQEFLHALKGTAGTMGFDGLYGLLSKAERAVREGEADTLMLSREIYHEIEKWIPVCKTLIDIMATEPATADEGTAGAIDDIELKSRWSKFMEEVVSNNMAALETFKSVKPVMEKISRTATREFENSLYQLRFKECANLLESFNERMDDITEQTNAD